MTSDPRRLVQRATSVLASIAAVAVAAMGILTIADVLSNNLLRAPIRGVFDLVEFTLVVTVFFGLPDVFRREAHIVVDVVDHLVPRWRDPLRRFARYVTFGFLALLLVAMWTPFTDTIRYPEHKQETGLPTWSFWIVILAGCLASIFAIVSRGRRTSAVGDGKRA